jgi:hypothetical protein
VIGTLLSLLFRAVGWLICATDMSDEEKAYHRGFDAQSGWSNTDIVDEVERRGMLSRRQADDARDSAHKVDMQNERTGYVW